LAWLFSHPEERFFVRQLASLLRVDSTNLSRELARLKDLGLVRGHREGQQKYFQVDPGSPIYPELQALVRKTAGAAPLLRQALEPLRDRLIAAFLYGSSAQGRVTADSDIDLMIIGDVSLAEVLEAVGPYQELLGREINPSIYPLAEFQDRISHAHPFLSTVMTGPKISLLGDLHELEPVVEERLVD
jgi:predicted nucleotidyltransferase